VKSVFKKLVIEEGMGKAGAMADYYLKQLPNQHLRYFYTRIAALCCGVMHRDDSDEM